MPVKGHSTYGDEYEHNPSGNLISSAKELNLWMLYNLGTYSKPTFKGVLRQSTLQEMWTTQKAIPDNRTSIGWGWWIYEDDKYGTSVFHVGNNPGFCSILMIYPEKNFGFTILCNGWYAQEAVWHKISDELVNVYLEK